MKINILLDINVVLDLLLRRGPDYHGKAEIFAFLRQQEHSLFFAACALPSLEYIHTREIKRLADEGMIKCSISPRELAKRQLSRFMAAIQIAPSLGSHWRRIPEDHPDREDGLISFAAAELPGPTFIWTNDEDFSPAVSEMTFGNYLSLKRYLEKATQANLPFVDLGYQQIIIRENLEGGIFRVLKHGNYIMGPEIKELETKLATYVGVKHAIGCASGTDALLMALMALDVGPFDAVFTTPFTFIATAEVISLLGATPVFVDIDPRTFNIDPQKLEKAIVAVKDNNPSRHPLPLTPNSSPLTPEKSGDMTRIRGKSGDTIPNSCEFGSCPQISSRLTPRAIIPVDLFGLTADYDAIDAIAKKHDLFVIEDAAQSFGAEYKGKKSCAFGHIACTSFFPAKPLGCYGDGGMCFTTDDALAAQLDSIRVHGKGSHKYDNARIGINGRLDTLQAAILLAKFDIFPEEVTLRQEAAARYTSLLTVKYGDMTRILANSGHVPIFHALRLTPHSSLLTYPQGINQSGRNIPSWQKMKVTGPLSRRSFRKTRSPRRSTTPSPCTSKQHLRAWDINLVISLEAKTPQTVSSVCPCIRTCQKRIRNGSSMS